MKFTDSLSALMAFALILGAAVFYVPSVRATWGLMPVTPCPHCSDFDWKYDGFRPGWVCRGCGTATGEPAHVEDVPTDDVPIETGEGARTAASRPNPPAVPLEAGAYAAPRTPSSVE